MKLQIDTVNKTIQVINSELNLGELIKELKKLFPNGEWKKFSIEKSVEYYPYYPWLYYSVDIAKDSDEQPTFNTPDYFYYDGNGTSGYGGVHDTITNDKGDELNLFGFFDGHYTP